MVHGFALNRLLGKLGPSLRDDLPANKGEWRIVPRLSDQRHLRPVPGRGGGAALQPGSPSGGLLASSDSSGGATATSRRGAISPSDVPLYYLLWATASGPESW